MLKIAIQGQPASFHDQAAHALCTLPFTLVPCGTFTEVFAALHEGKADLAVCAIENSLYGTINEVYDLLRHEQAWIIAEHYIHIQQNIIGLPGADLASASEVYSHPVALAQCTEFLDSQLAHAERHEHEDTAGAVADIKKWGDPHKVAIASAYAAAHYDLPVLRTHVENDHHNYTRFVLLSPEPPTPASDATKTSLILDTRHAPGALAHVLSAFAIQGINLTMLTSRPIVGDPGHYRFYIDLGAGEQTPAFQKVKAAIAATGCTFTILGAYPAAPLPWNF